MRKLSREKVERMRNMILECFSAKYFSSRVVEFVNVSTPLRNEKNEANQMLVFWMTK
jgi:hypothetical protein